MKPALPFAATAAAAAACSIAAQAAQPVCQAHSPAQAPTVVELYTSEGCSSCPPADRWLSTLKGRADVLPLAFHVTYWDRLGWPDRFATSESTARQWELARRSGSAQVYTPQVLVNGRDWRNWPELPAKRPALAIQVTLSREGDALKAEIPPAAGAPARLAGYWAVLEDRHESRVQRGENAGETLRHDHVVRLYRPVEAWDARSAQLWRLSVSPGVPEHPRRVAFVVTDAQTGAPLQAVTLGC